MSGNTGAVLHDRATRGEQLTSEEQQLLDAWYDEQDQAEQTVLAQSTLETDLAVLRAQLEVAMHQLALVSQSINAAMQANTELRHDIARLQAQLSSQPTGRAA